MSEQANPQKMQITIRKGSEEIISKLVYASTDGATLKVGDGFRMPKGDEWIWGEVKSKLIDHKDNALVWKIDAIQIEPLKQYVTFKTFDIKD
jgi:hypothetical protein